MLFKLLNLNSNLALIRGYLNPALYNSAQLFIIYIYHLSFIILPVGWLSCYKRDPQPLL